MTSAMIAAACVGHVDSAAAQAAPAALSRAELATRIDSLSERVRELTSVVQRRDSARAAAIPTLRTDTVRVGPFLLVSRGTAPPGLVAALAAAWESYAVMVGGAAARLDGIVISPDVAPGELAAADPSLRHYSIYTGSRRTDHADAARRAIADILVAESPADVRAWLHGAGLGGRDTHQWAYRSLAVSEHAVLRDCFDNDTRACVAVLTGTAAHDAPAAVPGSALHYVLARGGAGSYARLSADAPDMRVRLARAAAAPIDDIATDWRRVVQDARPRVHAGVARAGFWTLVWLCGLAILATRSTRWRLG